MTDVEVSAEIKAPAERVWHMVSDVTRMGSWSPETTSCRWIKGASGPAPGARFRGSNRSGWRRWSTTCTVTDAAPGEVFAFDVDYSGIPIARWEYHFESSGTATKVTETWTDRRPQWMRLASIPVMGVADRAGHNRRGMETTLAALKQAAESA